VLHYIVQSWKSLCEGAAGGPDPNDGDPADLPEVGKTVMMTLWCTRSHIGRCTLLMSFPLAGSTSSIYGSFSNR